MVTHEIRTTSQFPSFIPELSSLSKSTTFCSSALRCFGSLASAVTDRPYSPTRLYRSEVRTSRRTCFPVAPVPPKTIALSPASGPYAFLQRRYETEDPRESVPGTILLRLGWSVLEACFLKSFSGGRVFYRRMMSRTVGADAQARRGADTCCCGGGCRVLSDLGM